MAETSLENVIWAEFDPVTPDDMDRLLGRLNSTTCLLDPCPSWMVLATRDVLFPFPQYSQQRVSQRPPFLIYLHIYKCPGYVYPRACQVSGDNKEITDKARITHEYILPSIDTDCPPKFITLSKTKNQEVPPPIYSLCRCHCMTIMTWLCPNSSAAAHADHAYITLHHSKTVLGALPNQKEAPWNQALPAPPPPFEWVPGRERAQEKQGWPGLLPHFLNHPSPGVRVQEPGSQHYPSPQGPSPGADDWDAVGLGSAHGRPALGQGHERRRHLPRRNQSRIPSTRSNIGNDPSASGSLVRCGLRIPPIRPRRQ
ncbi:uncharacterized protein LOC131191063 [Ahaetulla prasina]|uniref:uncharacterized protein LOC131191063 n=1 Tax=Ahaetulla prasina TaxID=499056 RepID=UPI002649A410|nr:uncharacterized protein LOC131191063 [Ahaetulla prasina]XP_058024798.1 uncharacterized protein LOC131191063 [Ahaetulla prasina]